MSLECYRQATLERKIPDGKVTLVSWIPEEFAVVGSTVELYEDNEKVPVRERWTEGWEVVGIGERVEKRDSLGILIVRSNTKRLCLDYIGV